MNILSIGNSFSEDAQRYIHDIARNAGVTVNTYNLYIGGCPLEWHFRHMLSEEKRYALGVNGHNTCFFTSIKDALLSCDWDVVTLQQASHYSINYETYQPYLSELARYVRTLCPKAKIAIHQTWAYEEGSDRLTKELKYKTRADMFADIKNAYSKAAMDINADIVIPSGELMEALAESGIKVHRDTFHASLGTARYAIGLLWFSRLTGNSVEGDSFSLFDEEVTEEERSIVQKCVCDIVGKR